MNPEKQTSEAHSDVQTPKEKTEVCGEGANSPSESVSFSESPRMDQTEVSNSKPEFESKRKRRRLWLPLLLILLLAAIAAALYFRLPERLFVPSMGRILHAEEVALDQLGKPYIFGDAGPDSFDCSGLMKFAYETVGVELFHNTKVVANDDSYETIKDPADLREGDLVFFDTISGGSQIDHVGFWLGNNRFVHASSSQGEVVISEFDEKWQNRYSWAKRIL